MSEQPDADLQAEITRLKEELAELDAEWERLDSQGTMNIQRHSIANGIESKSNRLEEFEGKLKGTQS